MEKGFLLMIKNYLKSMNKFEIVVTLLIVQLILHILELIIDIGQIL
jgi:hypothetical protein